MYSHVRNLNYVTQCIGAIFNLVLVEFETQWASMKKIWANTFLQPPSPRICSHTEMI